MMRAMKSSPQKAETCLGYYFGDPHFKPLILNDVCIHGTGALPRMDRSLPCQRGCQRTWLITYGGNAMLDLTSTLTAKQPCSTLGLSNPRPANF